MNWPRNLRWEDMSRTEWTDLVLKDKVTIKGALPSTLDECSIVVQILKQK